MNCTIRKTELVQILNANRAKHRAAFEEALQGYRAAKISELEKALEDARQGNRFFDHSELVRPVDQTREYDRAIRMLELTTDTEIRLSETEFQNYVLDRWNWSKVFAASNKGYMSSSDGMTYMDSIESA